MDLKVCLMDVWTQTPQVTYSPQLDGVIAWNVCGRLVVKIQYYNCWIAAFNLLQHDSLYSSL